MASTPIIRYYEQLTAGVRSAAATDADSPDDSRRGDGQGEGNRRSCKTGRRASRGKAPGKKDGSQRADPLQQPDSLAIGPAAKPTLNDSDFWKLP